MRPLVSLAVIGLSSMTAGQTLYGEFPIGSAAMGPAGDVDGDGVGDFFVSGQVYSGADLALLLDVGNTSASDVVDWDGDGGADLVVGRDVNFEVYSIATGQKIYSDNDLCLGFCDSIEEICNIGDVDGNGRDDVAIIGYDLCDMYILDVRLLGGPSVPEQTLNPPDSFSRVSGLGDVDGDGLDDYGYLEALGYLGYASTTTSLVIGPPAQAVLTISAPDFINDLSAIDDFDGDGLGDLIVAVDGPAAETRIVSSSDFATVLTTLPHYDRVVSPGDVDCDGVPDVLGANIQLGVDDGMAELRSGANGSVLWSVTGAPGEALRFVAAPGDVDGDGLGDWMVGGQGAAPVTRVYVADEPSIPTYCTSKLNSLGCAPLIDAGGLPTLSGPDDFLLLTRDALPGKPGLFFWGRNGRLAVPFLGGTLCVAPPLARTPVQLAAGLVECEGGYAFHFSQAYMAQEGLGPGAIVNGQYWMRDPAQPDGTGVALSNGIEFPICP